MVLYSIIKQNRERYHVEPDEFVAQLTMVNLKRQTTIV
jgi:hypothetical protein